MISTDEIIRDRLCLVCARDGVRKPVSEHDVEHEHFKATLFCLEGLWVMANKIVIWNNGYEWEPVPNNWPFSSDLWRMAVEVGGVMKWALDGNRWPLWKAFGAQPYPECLVETPEEAVQRAYMEQLWERGAKHGS